jgi:hypothetical protein
MLSRISNFSGPLSILFKRNLDQNNLILDLRSKIGLSEITWQDQSSYNNDATFYGSIVTDSINGEIVLSLDGVNEYIYPTNGFGNILDTGFTYEVWARPGTSSNGVLLLETGQAATSSLWNDNQMAFVSNKINVGLFNPNDFTPNYITGPTFLVDTWYNIVMTYDGNTLIEYVNGVSVGSSIGVKSNPSSTYLSLGRPGLATNYLGGSTGHFKGYIGVWRIWDGPLDSTEVLLNYNTSRESYDAFITNNTILYLDAGSSASYPGSGSIWYDLSVQDNDATMSNTTYSGINGGYFTFDGTINSKGSLTSAKYNVPYSGKTVFVTAYLSSHMANGVNTYRAILGSSDGSRNFNFYIQRDISGNYKLHYSAGGQGGNSINLTSFTPGTWFTAAVTHTTDGLISYYFNGQLVGTGSGAFFQYLPGGTEGVGGADNFWDGRIGLASVYKVALSSSEILQNHNGVKNRYSNFVDTNLVLYFNPNKDLNYPNSINDLSGNSLNGTLSNNTFTAPYLNFNGTSSQITIADNSLLEPGSGSFTMEAWVNQSVAGNDVVLGKFNNGGASQHVSYSIRTTSTTFYGQFGSGSGSGSTLVVNSTNHVGTLNTWYQIVYVFKNGVTKNLETFVNGTSIGTVSHNLPSILNSTNPLYIGSYNGGEFTQWFHGKIGIVRFYSSALSDSDVSKNFEANRGLYGI